MNGYKKLVPNVNLLTDYLDESPPAKINNMSGKNRVKIKSMTKSGLPSSIPLLSTKSSVDSSQKKDHR